MTPDSDEGEDAGPEKNGQTGRERGRCGGRRPEGQRAHWRRRWPTGGSGASEGSVEMLATFFLLKIAL